MGEGLQKTVEVRVVFGVFVLITRATTFDDSGHQQMSWSIIYEDSMRSAAMQPAMANSVRTA